MTNSGTLVPVDSADGAPQLLVHAIEVTGFAPLGLAMTTYIGWQDLRRRPAASHRCRCGIHSGIQPRITIPA
ncbi:MAG: hypothetical protein R2838_21205 [Caldilineaceae bacterium]